MKSKKAVESQLNVLLTGMARDGIAHLEEMESDLLQTNALLEEAANKLNDSFMALHETLQMQTEATAQALSGADSAQEKGRQLAGDVAGRIDCIVTGLQFQDMTSQLIGRALSRIEGLRSMLGAFASTSPALLQQEGSEGMVGTLERINKRLALHSRELNGQLEKTVRQRHLEGGSVELYS